MSTFTKGEQMIPVLNQCNVHCAVFGNHDFDYGLENLISVTKKTRFPWLMSNVLDVYTGRPLAEGQLYHIINKNGIKLGLIGLVEEEWLATLATIEQKDVIYKDFVEEGKRLVKMLKEKEKVDYIIALTHMRMPNDQRLASNVDGIDIILGGHDHDYEVKIVNSKHIIKSGTDFRTFSFIQLHFDKLTGSKSDVNSSAIERPNHKGDLSQVKCIKVQVTRREVRSDEFKEDTELAEQFKQYQDLIKAKMDIVLGEFAIDLDGRFASIRTQETNLGNFVCDIMLSSTHSDLAILNSGTLRSDRIHPKGEFKLRDLVTIMPMMDPMIVLLATGDQIHRALENGVSQYPKLEGRFPQVAGVTFAFDPTGEPRKRIDPKHIWVGDEPLDLNQNYRLVTKAYLHQGKDGYTVLQDCQVLVDEEQCPELCTSIQNHFEAIRIYNEMLRSKHAVPMHHQSLNCSSRRSSEIRLTEGINHPSTLSTSTSSSLSTTSHDSSSTDVLNSSHHIPLVKKVYTPEVILRKNSRRLSTEEIERKQCKLEPQVEGRIRIITDQVLKEITTRWQAWNPKSK